MGNAPPGQFRFRVEQRIKQNRDFVRAKAQGKRLVHGCLIANYLELPAGSVSRLGVITSRKVGGAVERSRARRLLRECFRVHQSEIEPPVDLVLIARPSISGKDYNQVEEDLLTALKRARLLKSDEQS